MIPIYNPEKDIKLPYKYTPRWYQIPFFQALEMGYKRFDLVWHRRAGKDISIINATSTAMGGKWKTDNGIFKLAKYSEIGTYYYFFPTFAQGKKVIWDGMTKDGIRFLDFIPERLRYKTWNDEMKIRLNNGSLFQIIGTDNFDAIMGTNPIWCVFSEYALQNPQAYEYIRPILLENNGIAIFPYTPRGRNHAYKLHITAEDNPDHWFSQVLTVDDTKVISKEAIEQEIKEGMSEELAQQEYYCSFMQGIEGSYYGKQIQKAREGGRIKSILVDDATPVHTAWDIGVTDFTSIIFFQQFPGEYHIVDFYENQGEGVQHYAKVLQDKGYTYGNHYGPHDLKSKSWAYEGKPTIQVASEYGIHFQIVPKMSKEDRCEAGRNLISKCYFNNNPEVLKLLNHLENFTKIYNKTMGCYMNTPKHDIHSHAGDSWGYFGVSQKSQEIYNPNRILGEIEDNIQKHCSKYAGGP